MAKGKKCRYETCIRLARVKSDTCGACAARHHYWDKQTVGKRLERRRRLMLSNETMYEFVTDNKLDTYVRKEHKTEVRRWRKEERKANGQARA